MYCTVPLNSRYADYSTVPAGYTSILYEYTEGAYGAEMVY